MTLIWDIRLLIVAGALIKLIAIHPIVPSDRVGPLNELGTLLVGAGLGILQEKSEGKD